MIDKQLEQELKLFAEIASYLKHEAMFKKYNKKPKINTNDIYGYILCILCTILSIILS